MTEIPKTINNKLLMHVNMAICDEAYVMYKIRGDYASFGNWCKQIKTEITILNGPDQKSWVNRKWIDIQVELVEYTMDVFGFSVEESYALVFHFFMGEIWFEYETISSDMYRLFHKRVQQVFNRKKI